MDTAPAEIVLHIVRVGALSGRDAARLAQTCRGLWGLREALRAACRYTLLMTVPPASEEAVAAGLAQQDDCECPQRTCFSASGRFLFHGLTTDHGDAVHPLALYPTPGIVYTGVHPSFDVEADPLPDDCECREGEGLYVGMLPEGLRYPPLCLGNPEFFGWLSPDRENRYAMGPFGFGVFADRLSEPPRVMWACQEDDESNEFERAWWIMPARCVMVSANSGLANFDGEDVHAILRNDGRNEEYNRWQPFGERLSEFVGLYPSASPDLTFMAGAAGGTVKVYDTSAGFPPTAWTEIAAVPLVDGELASRSSLCWAEDSRRLAVLLSSADASTVHVVDLATMAVEMTLAGSADGATLAFSPDGARLVSGGEGEFTVFSLATREVVARIPEGGKQVAWSVDGRHIAITTGMHLRIYSA